MPSTVTASRTWSAERGRRRGGAGRGRRGRRGRGVVGVGHHERPAALAAGLRRALEADAGAQAVAAGDRVAGHGQRDAHLRLGASADAHALDEADLVGLGTADERHPHPAPTGPAAAVDQRRLDLEAVAGGDGRGRRGHARHPQLGPLRLRVRAWRGDGGYGDDRQRGDRRLDAQGLLLGWAARVLRAELPRCIPGAAGSKPVCPSAALSRRARNGRRPRSAARRARPPGATRRGARTARASTPAASR